MLTKISNSNHVHVDCVFQYVRSNIPGPNLEQKSFEDQFSGCECQPPGSGCNSTTCSCMRRFGAAYDEKHRLVDIDPYSDAMRPVYECNGACTCGVDCANRVVQHEVACDLAVFRTPLKGFGVRTLQAVLRGSFVCEYAGEVLTREEARRRAANLTNADCNYILALREHVTADGKDHVITTYVDPMYIGNVGRFVNHSCSPNLFMVPVRVNNDVPHLGLFAIDDIAAGTELCFDYSGVVQRPDAKATNDHITVDVAPTHRKPCHCSSATCRQYLPFDETLYDN